MALVQAAEVVLTNPLWDRFRRQAGRRGQWRPWRGDEDVASAESPAAHGDLDELAIAEADRLRSARRRQSAVSLVTCGNGARVFEVRSQRIAATARGVSSPAVVVLCRDVTETASLRWAAASPKRGRPLQEQLLHDIRNQLMGASLQAHLIGANQPCRAQHAAETAALSAIIRGVAQRLDAPAVAEGRPARARSGRGQRLGMS